MTLTKSADASMPGTLRQGSTDEGNPLHTGYDLGSTVLLMTVSALVFFAAATLWWPT